MALCLAFPTMADSPQDHHITLGTYYIPGLAESPNDGLLIDLVQDIGRESGLTIDLEFAPTKRIQRQFATGEILGYFPELAEHAPPDACRSVPIGYKTIFAFRRKGDFAPQTIADLEHKTVGIVAGYSYGTEIMQNQRIYKEIAANDDLNLRKLLAGRIDYIIGDDRSTVAAVKKADAEAAISWQRNTPITSLPFFFLFQNSPRGHKFCEIFSRVMQEGSANGKLRSL